MITSRDAAALRDVLTTLKRRDPSVAVILFPVKVQGESAAGTIRGLIEGANRFAAGTPQYDDITCLAVRVDPRDPAPAGQP